VTDGRLIQNCAPRFQFRCPKRWDALQPTPHPGVRHCGACDRPVYLSADVEQALSHARQGRCVALLAPLALPTLAPPSRAVDLGVVDPWVLGLVPREIALKHLIIPVRKDGTTLVVAATAPLGLHAADDLRFLTGLEPEAVSATADEIREAIERHYDQQQHVELGIMDTELEPEPDETPADDAPIVRLLELILRNACKKDVARVTLELSDRRFVIFFEKDGVTSEETVPPRKLWPPVIARIRHMLRAPGTIPGQLWFSPLPGHSETFLVSADPGDSRVTLERTRRGA